MVIRVHQSGASMHGLLNYHEQKVHQGKAQILGLHNILFYNTKTKDLSFGQKLKHFEHNIEQTSSKSKKITFHASFNPSEPDMEKVNDTNIDEIVKNYMEKMGYGKTPYILYKHTDVDRRHYHIVGVRFDNMGHKISDRFEHQRTETIRKQISKEMGLTEAIQDKKENIGTSVAYGQKELLEAVKINIEKTLTENPTNWPQYKERLKAANIGYTFIMQDNKKGLLYHALDQNGKRTGVAFKASQIGGDSTLANLSKRFKTNQNNQQTTNQQTDTQNRTVESPYKKTNIVLIEWYRNERRSGKFFFESKLINALPGLAESIKTKLNKEFPAQPLENQKTIDSFIKFKTEDLKNIIIKEQGYFKLTSDMAMQFAKQFDPKTSKIQIAKFFELNNIKTSQTNKNGIDFLNLHHSQSNHVAHTIEMPSKNFKDLPTVSIEKTYDKQTKSIIAAFIDPSKINELVKINGHGYLLQNEAFQMLNKNSQNEFLKKMNSTILYNQLQPFNQDTPKQLIRSNLFLKGFIPTEENALYHVSLGKEAATIPNIKEESTAETRAAIKTMRGLALYPNTNDPKTLYKQMVQLNQALESDNQKSIQTILGHISEKKPTIAESIKQLIKDYGNSKEPLLTEINKLFLTHLAQTPQEQEENQNLNFNTYSIENQLSKLLPSTFEGSNQSKGVIDKFENKKHKKIKGFKIKRN